jgi:CRISP-associated protein Cas1
VIESRDFLTQLGEYKGHLWSAESMDLVLETAQFERRRDEAFQLAIARSIVQGKLWNSKQLLRLNPYLGQFAWGGAAEGVFGV